MPIAAAGNEADDGSAGRRVEQEGRLEALLDVQVVTLVMHAQLELQITADHTQRGDPIKVTAPAVAGAAEYYRCRWRA